MSNQKSLIEQMSDEVIVRAIEEAASRLVGNTVKWSGFNSDLQNMVKARAIQLMETDPEINAKIKAGLIEGIESWNKPKTR